jgi:2-polyprenyl-3-methyl-5-hydroxy-6-metoxy-1,4-benzoquinol methylase
MKTGRFETVLHPEGFVSASPLPTADELRKFYAEVYYQVPQTTTYQAEYSERELSWKRLKAETVLAALGELGVNGNEFLDVGAGEGFLMSAAEARGFNVTGMDFSSFGIDRFFPHLTDRVIAGDIYDSIEHALKAGRRYNVCSLVNVLEHVIDPAGLLTSVRRLLAPDGVLVICVPNDFSELQQLAKTENLIAEQFWFLPPQHLHYFNAENLPRFCERRGFELVDAYSEFPIDMYLLHPGSNYVTNRENGPAANRARLLFDLLIAQRGSARFLAFYRAMFQVGVGRNVTVLLRPLKE